MSQNQYISQSSSFSSGQKIGLFGGSFDPPHDGHLHVAQTALNQVGLHKVIWLLSPQNRLKSRQARPYEDRRDWVLKKTKANPRFVVSDFEFQHNIRTTIKTVVQLTQRFPKTKFYMIMGGDSFSDFDQWVSWKEITRLAPLIIVSRPGSTIRVGLAKSAAQLIRYSKLDTQSTWHYRVIYAPLHQISSTKIRKIENQDYVS